MKKLKKVQEHFKFKLTDNWSNECYFYIYEESTADGYSVFVATEDPSNINVNEDVHYYDSDLTNSLTEAIRALEYLDKEGQNIYIDDINSEFVEEAMEELYELVINKTMETLNKLIDKKND